MTDPSFANTQSPDPDELLVGGPIKTRTVTITDLGGAGALTRGAVLGKVTAGGAYGLSASAAGDGSEVARAVLAQAADPSGGDVQALVYEMADVNEDALSFGTGHDADSVREDLRAVAVHLKKPISR